MYRVGIFASRREANIAMIDLAVERQFIEYKEKSLRGILLPSQKKNFVRHLHKIAGKTEESLLCACKTFGKDFTTFDQEEYIEDDGGWQIRFCHEGEWTVKYETFYVNRSLVLDRLEELHGENEALKKKLKAAKRKLSESEK